MGPDAFLVFFEEIIQKGVHYGVFRIWVNFPCEIKEG
jgi:hypothetical protein